MTDEWHECSEVDEGRIAAIKSWPSRALAELKIRVVSVRRHAQIRPNRVLKPSFDKTSLELLGPFESARGNRLFRGWHR
jgi:hypothetical protein